MKKKISDYFNFNSKILNFLGFRFVVPFSSYDQNGFLLFKIILSSFILVIFNQIIKARFDYYIKINQIKENINNEINNTKSKFGFLLPLVSSILILSLTDIIRDLAGHFEYNKQNVLMNIPMTLKAFFFINFLKFFMSSLKRLLKIFDSQF